MIKFRLLNSVIFAAGVISMVQGSADDFRINQLGYYPGANKVVPVMFTNESTFALVDESGDTVFQGNLSKIFRWSDTKDTIRQADFSSFKDVGTYFLRVADKGTSLPIYIRENVLYDVSLAAFKTFYYQRASMPLEEEYAGKFARAAGHPDTACIFHSSTGKDSATASSPGGWYDAGDFGKYVVNAGVSLGNLFFFYENFGNYFGDAALNIPESGNDVDDFLDEMKYELDWLLTMQDTDGGVFHKLTTLQHAGLNVMPDKDKAARYFIGKSTSATLNFAAVMAMAGRVYAKIPSQKEFADTCLSRAKWAWDWAIANPRMFFSRNPAGVGTGAYEDTVLVNDEFLWASAELFITTGDVFYRDSLKLDRLDLSWPADWKTPGRLTPLSLATIPSDLTSDEVEEVRKLLIKSADGYVTQIRNHGFRIPAGKFYYWGSNGVFANCGLFLLAAFKVSQDTSYARAAAEIADYLLGKNAVNTSFVTGFGITRSQYPHHRQCIADTVMDAIPGFVVGGPNGNPATYTDAEGDYETNEVAINWNAPASALFAALNSIFGKNEHTIDDSLYTLIRIEEGNGRIVVTPEKNSYAYGETVKLAAVPDSGERFLGWSGVFSSIDSIVTIQVTRDMKIVAEFGKPKQMLVNGDFSNGKNGWTLMGATSTVSNGEYRINITTPGTTNWAVQLVQGGLTLYNGVTYVFKFDVRSDSVRTIIADVAQSSGNYSSYMGAKTCKLDTIMKHFEYKFKMTSATDKGARITFNCGLSANDVIFDNVSLMIFDPSPVIESVRFTQGLQKVILRMVGNQMVVQLPVVVPNKAKLEIFDAQGRLKNNMTDKVRYLNPGTHLLNMDINFSSGIYFIRYYDGKEYHFSPMTSIRK